MSQTFINYKDKGYWMPDSAIALIARYILEATDDENLSPWLKEYRLFLSDVSMDSRPGWLSLKLNHFLIDAERIDDFLNILGKTVIYLRGKGSTLTVSELNTHKNRHPLEYQGGEWAQEIQTENVIKMVRHLQGIVKETEGNDSDVNYLLILTSS